MTAAKWLPVTAAAWAGVIAAGVPAQDAGQPPAGAAAPAAPKLRAVAWRKTEIAKGKHQAFPAWSADGNTVGFVSFDDGRNVRVWATDPGGKNQRLIFEGKEFLTSDNLDMFPCALHWLRNPEALVLAVMVFDKSRMPATQAGTEPTKKVGMDANGAGRLLPGPGVKVGPPGSTTQVGSPQAPVQVIHKVSYDRPWEPSEMRAYLIAPDEPNKAKLMAALDTIKTKSNRNCLAGRPPRWR